MEYKIQVELEWNHCDFQRFFLLICFFSLSLFLSVSAGCCFLLFFLRKRVTNSNFKEEKNAIWKERSKKNSQTEERKREKQISTKVNLLQNWCIKLLAVHTNCYNSYEFQSGDFFNIWLTQFSINPSLRLLSILCAQSQIRFTCFFFFSSSSYWCAAAWPFRNHFNKISAYDLNWVAFYVRHTKSLTEMLMMKKIIWHLCSYAFHNI